MIYSGIAIDSTGCICADKIPMIIIDSPSANILGMLT
jgi:hypothetical protein